MYNYNPDSSEEIWKAVGPVCNQAAEETVLVYKLKKNNRVLDYQPNYGSGSQIIEDDQDKAEAMANHFGTVFTQEPLPDDKLDQNTKSQNRLTVDFVWDDILKALSTSDMEKSTGPDELHPKILRQIARYIIALTTTTFNMLLSQGELPTDWKDEIVTTIHKIGSKQLPSNYRPLSLTSDVVKILEITKKAIMTSVETNNLLNSEQYGFRKGLSRIINLLIVSEQWVEDLDNGKSVDIV